MTSKTIASRYARALLNSGLPEQTDKIRQDLRTILDTYKAHPRMTKILQHPIISQADKKTMLIQTLGDKIGSVLMRFTEILIAKKRISLLPDIAEIYNLMADESLGVIKARVRTPFPISETQQTAIKDKLTRITKKNIIMDFELNPALIGGITIKIGDQVMDGSIQARLRDLKEKLLAKA